MSNPNTKFATRSWLQAATLSYLVRGGTITRCRPYRNRGGRYYNIVL
jgi:hypothetical protein